MKTLKIENDDLVFDDQNNLVLIDGDDEAAQSMERIMTTHKREWFLNRDFGFDYGLLTVKQINKDAVRLGIIEAATQDQRTQRVLSVAVEINNANRHGLVNFKAVTESGAVIESEVG